MGPAVTAAVALVLFLLLVWVVWRRIKKKQERQEKTWFKVLRRTWFIFLIVWFFLGIALIASYWLSIAGLFVVVLGLGLAALPYLAKFTTTTVRFLRGGGFRRSPIPGRNLEFLSLSGLRVNRRTMLGVMAPLAAMALIAFEFWILSIASKSPNGPFYDTGQERMLITILLVGASILIPAAIAYGISAWRPVISGTAGCFLVTLVVVLTTVYAAWPFWMEPWGWA